ncbi:hypothetical protein CXF72_00890 [Psychromonas sp. MB-3u-54]|uniref:GGDEF domain-containing protein n=1 Tax=Psychromonas sp. MB-3u-54 TaxID=2058319 RepID=UPI000C3485AF|nr:GGDEF domain-containing protein [Psychromonas sp. MB-3u-54]PKH04470.1 hypothetical protein CXF72_00890 [Psychromonas sp. MB-3u-54]
MNNPIPISRHTDRPEKHLSRVKLILFIIFLFSILSTSAISWHYYQQERQSFIESIELKPSSKSASIVGDLKLIIQDILTDALFLATMQKHFFNDLPSTAYAHTEQMMLAMSQVHNSYETLRVLDANGQERVRINQLDSGSEVIKPDNLQNKSNRYYYQIGRELKAGQVYVSPLDLKMEHGQIEAPFQPMMRFIIPVYLKDTLHSMVIINYKAQRIMNVLESYTSKRVSLTLLNSDGYWLKSPQKEQQWGFMFADKQDLKFETLYPDVWAAMQTQDSGRIVLDEGIYSYNTIKFMDTQQNEKYKGDPSVLGGEVPITPLWKMVSFLPQDEVLKDLGPMRIGYFLMLLVILSLILLSGVVFYRIYTFRHNYQNFLFKHAYFDGLTGAYDRIGLQDLTDKLVRKKVNFSFISMDLDDFKPINDNYGHLCGDKVLQLVVNRISNLLRTDDYIFRMGGDEFIVLVYGDFPLSDLEAVSHRIESEVVKPMEINELTFMVGISTGISQLKSSGTVEEMLNTADINMYASKNAKRQ